MNVGTGEDVGGRVDNTPVDTTFDAEALEAKLESKFEVLNDREDDGGLESEVVDDSDVAVADEADADDLDDSQPDQDDTDSESQGHDDRQGSEDDAEIEEGDDEDAATDEAPAPKSGTAKVPTLPDSYRRSLAAYGWTDEEIDTNMATLGGKFVEVASTIHAKRNAEIAQWAEVGRKAREANANNQQQPQTLVHGPVAGDVPQPLAPIDLKKMKEKYGEEEMLEEIVGPVNATIAALNSVLPQIQQGVKSIHQSQMDEALNRVNKFFDADNMSAYRKFYGGAGQDRSSTQVTNRAKVLEEAVMAMEGAKALNQELSLENALQRAHDYIAADFREQAVRKNIKRQVKKQNRGISQKPSKRGAAATTSTSKPKSPADLERKVGIMLKQVFKK